jgi:hypothetical protein
MRLSTCGQGGVAMVRCIQGLRRGDVDGLQCCQLFGAGERARWPGISAVVDWMLDAGGGIGCAGCDRWAAVRRLALRGVVGLVGQGSGFDDVGSDVAEFAVQGLAGGA